MLRKSYMDSFRDFSYSAIRMSLPTCAERAAQVYPPRMAQTLEMREAAAILSPVANSTSRVAPDVPRLSISASSTFVRPGRFLIFPGWQTIAMASPPMMQL
ncbi:hypothetical protein B5E66_05385 [Faecalibacterium sp. An121]|nr:hypothetical protein B5E66_05385 [Faecalibacterium sp. An121]